MNKGRIALAACGALLALGCDKETGPFLAPTQSIAYVRYVNAVPDSGAFDWRLVDAIENSPPANGLAFRGFTPYQAMGTGARKLRIFPTSTDIAITSQIVIDTTITFSASTYYTLIHLGFARAGSSPADRIVVLQDQFPASLGSQVAVRAVNVASGLGNLDVFQAAATADPLPGSPKFSGVAYGIATAYVAGAVGPINLRMTASGTTTPVLASVVADTGQTAVPASNLTAIGGSRQAGSVISAYLFPRSVTGTAAPQTTAFQSPVVVYVVDKHP